MIDGDRSQASVVQMSAEKAAADGSASLPGDLPTYSQGPLTVSVVVPVYNGGPAFALCLDNLLAAQPAPDEIFVVDDGSTDGSDRVASRPGITLLRTGRCQGPAVARNLGASAARGDLFFFVDADVLVPSSVIDMILPCFSGPADAVIGSYEDRPAAPNFLSQYKNLLHHYVHQNASEEGFTFWSGCGVIRRQVFQRHSGFDERYDQPSIEDIELGYRLRAAGHCIRVCKQLQVKHCKRWNPVSLFWSDFFGRALPWTALILQTGRMHNDLNISWINRVRIALACLLLPLLAAAVWWPPALAGVCCLIPTLLILDFPVLRFFYKKRGLLFAARTVPWHWFSHVYSGVAFATGLALHLLCRRWAGCASRRNPSSNPLVATPAVEGR
jgi:glycosyltransferase involved in cell wall biosynthesis